MTSRPADFSRRALIAAAVAIAMVALALLLFWLRDVLLLAFAGALLGVLLSGPTDALTRLTPLPRPAALTVVVLLGLAVLVAAGWWMGPRIGEQMQGLAERVPAALDKLQERTGNLEDIGLPSPRTMLRSAAPLIQPTLGVLRGATGAVVAAIVLLFLGLYFAAQPEKYARLFLRLLPPSRRGRLYDVLAETNRKLRRWLLVRALCMLEVGVLTAAGLWLLGVDLAVTLGILAGLLNFVPNFGPITAAIPAVLIGFLSGPATALWVVGLYVGVQFIDNYIVGPLLEQRTVSLPAAVSILSQIALGLLLGIGGLVLATPLTLAAGVFIRRLYVEDVLSDRGDPES